MKEIYLDNAATTKVMDSVKDLMVKVMTEDYGNPSSKHRKGLDAERYVVSAREKIAATMKVDPKEIFFTSGGSESNNWALIGGALANQRAGKTIITTAVEHAAVRETAAFLKDLGFCIEILPVDSSGRISLEDLRAALSPSVILVSIMMVNNEIGTLEPIPEAGELIKSYKKDILFHVDAIQGYGKLPVFPRRWGVDLLSVSGHKIHAPKGSGFLYIHERTKIQPLIYGGGQQKGMRSGTENVPGIAGLGLAAEDACRDLAEKGKRMRELRALLRKGILSLPGSYINTPEEEAWTSPHILSASFEGVRSEVLLHALEERGIYVSAGSACTSNKKVPVSSVLEEIHLRKDLRESTIRFSFSEQTTEEEIRETLKALQEILPNLRRFTRR